MHKSKTNQVLNKNCMRLGSIENNLIVSSVKYNCCIFTKFLYTCINAKPFKRFSETVQQSHVLSLFRQLIESKQNKRN